MRKSFTRFLGLLALFCVLGFQVSLAGVKTRVPANGAPNVNKSTDLSITFDYALSEGAAYNGAVIQLKTGGVVVDQINVPSSRFTFSADMKTITMDVQATLLEGTLYSVEFPLNVVKENNPDGTTTPNPAYTVGTWDFTTGDFSKPVLAAVPFAPVDGATNVGAASPAQTTCNFRLVFNENVNGVSGKYIKIYNANGEIHEMVDCAAYTALGGINVDFASTNLRENTSYYILVDAGAFKDVSTNKNAFDGISDKTAWNFTTRDQSGPVLATGYPKFTNITKNSFNVVVKYNEAGNVKVQVNNAAGEPANYAAFGGAPTAITANTEVTIPVVQTTAGVPLDENTTDYYVYTAAINNAKTTDRVAATVDAADPLASTVSAAIHTKTLDQTAPVPTWASFIPLDNAVAVSRTADFQLRFNERVKKGAGNIIIYNGIDNSVFQTIDVTDATKVTFSTSGNWTATIKHNTLSSLKSYYIKIADGVIVDYNNSNSWGGITDNTTWNFTVNDYVAPIGTWSNPAANSLLTQNEAVRITYDEGIFTAAGAAFVGAVGGGNISTVIVVEQNNTVLPLANYTYTTGANWIAVVPTAGWAENTTYTIKVLANSVEDATGNTVTTELVKSYTTNSWTPPTVVFNPATGANVTSTRTFKVTFSEPIVLTGGTTITNDNVATMFEFVENGASFIAFTATWNATTNAATITPVNPLVSGKTYTLSVKASTYTDKNVPVANAPAGTPSASFTCVDSVIPTVLCDFTKTNVPVGAASNYLKFTFSEPIFKADLVTTYAANPNDLFNFITLRAGSATGTIVPINAAIANAGNSYTINPAAPLTAGATYYLAFAPNAVYDAAGNLNTAVNCTFVTAAAPNVTTLTPAHKSTTVVAAGLNSISLTFDETVKPNPGVPAHAGLFMVDHDADGGVTPAIPVEMVIQVASTGTTVAYCAQGAMTFVGNSATFPRTWVTGFAAFNPETKYQVAINAGCIFDADNNPNAAIAVADYYFTTTDVTAPTMTGVTVPATVAAVGVSGTNANLAGDIVITFSEKIKKGSGTITISDGATFNQNIDVNSSLVTIDNAGPFTATIQHNAFRASKYANANPGAPTEVVALYNVSMPAGTFKDLANLDVPALTDPAGARAAALAFVVDAAGTVADGTGDDGIADIVSGAATGFAAGVWYFTTDQNAAPVFLPASSSPLHLSDKNGINADLIINFNEQISIADANARVTVSLWNGAAWILAQSYKMSESPVTVSGTSIAVNLAALAANTEYEVTLDAGAVQDSQGGTNVAIATIAGTNPSNWNFNTGDINGPVATATIDGTYNAGTGAWTKVNRASNIVLTFDEAIRLQAGAAEVTSLNLVDASAGIAVNPANVIKLVTGGNGVAMEATISADKKTITIPAATIANYNLQSSTVYALNVANIEDAAGNNNVAQTFNFTIDDYTAPVNHGALGVTTNNLGTSIVLNLRFDEAANAYYWLAPDGTTAPTAAWLKANGTAVTSVPTAGKTVTIATTPGTEYELFVVGEDVVRYTLQAAVTNVNGGVRSADITDPTIATYGGNGKLDVDPTPAYAFDLTFGTDISNPVGGKNVYVFQASNDALVATLTGGALGVVGKVLTVTIPGATLTANNSYYLNIEKGIVTDLAGTVPNPDLPGKAVNQYPGLFDKTTYTFSTKDNIAPKVANAVPYAANTTAGTFSGAPAVTTSTVNQNVVVTFNENITTKTIGAGDIIINQGIAGAVKEVILLTNSSTTNITGSVLTINPTMTFTPGLVYEVVIAANTLQDLSGNANGLIKFSFTVEDTTPPVATFTALGTGLGLATNLINLAEAIRIDFDENVVLLDGSGIEIADIDSMVVIKDALLNEIAFTSVENSAKQWTITPVAAFKSNSTYTISFPQYLMDAAGNQLLAQSVTFKTKRVESPLIVFDPVKSGTNVVKDKSITITCNQSMVQEETTVGGGIAFGFFSVLENTELANYFTLTNQSTVPVSNVACNATISADKKVITIDPVVDFDSKANIWLTFDPRGNDGVAAGAIPDLVDSLNNLISFNTATFPNDPNVATNASKVDVTPGAGASVVTVKFTVADYVAPTLNAVAPSKNYIGTGFLTMTFSENVKAGSGDIKIYREDGTLVETIAASSTTLTYGANQTILRLNPSAAARENNMNYYVMIPAGAITDQANVPNPFAGINDNTTWIYYSALVENPVVETFVPANGATNVYVHDNIVVYFDKDVTLAGATGNISVYKRGGDAFDFIRVPAAGVKLLVDPINKKKLTVNFDRVLDANTEYYVTFEPNTVYNTKGNPAVGFAGFMDANTWKFSTENDAAPELITDGLIPADNATGIAYINNLTLQMTFNMNVKKGAGTVRVVDTATGILKESINIANATINGAVVTVPMTTKLMDDTRYHVFVDAGAVTNTLPSTVGFAGISAYDAWNFTTVKDETAPTAISFSPVTTGLLNNPAFTMTFSEQVVAGTGIISIYKAADNTLVETLTATITGASATFTVPTLLVDNTNYYVKVAPDAFKDKAKAPLYYAGIADATTWTFATGDNTAPTVVSVTPDTNDNATNEFDATIVFSEDVVNVAANVSVNTGFVTVTGSGATYVARITAADAAVVTLTIGTGIKDASERNSLATAVTRTYTVGDNTAPQLTITPPAVFNTTFALGLTFNEPVTIPEGAITVTNATTFSLATIDASHYTLSITGAEEAVIGVTFGATITDNSVNHKALVPVTRSYTIGDFTAPTVTAAPASGTNLPANFNVVLTFSPDAIVTSAGITVAGATTSTITNVANVFTVAITAPDNTSVTVTAANTIADEAGNLLAGTKVFTYVTGDNTKPTVVVDPVSARDTINSFDVTLIFSERVTIPTGAISVTPSTATIVYSVVSGNVYKALITAPDLTTVVMSLAGTIVDNAGNTLNPVSYTYTIGDHTGPTLASFTPATGTVLTDNHPTFTMTFNEPIVKGTGSIRITKVGAASASVTIPIAGATINGNTVTLTYVATTAGGLDRNTDYFVTIDAGAVKDASNNAYAGLSTATTWTFKTGPNWVTKIDVIGSLYTVYPNPFDGFVNVKGDISQLSKVVITSITGQKVKEVPATNQISTNELRSGIYFITLYNESEAIIKTERIVKR